MNLAELVERLDLKVFAAARSVARAVGGGYAGDLLSDVIAHGRKDQVWITIQIHPNIIAVAVLKELAAIVLANGREPAAETVARAGRSGCRSSGRRSRPSSSPGGFTGSGSAATDLMALRRFRADLHIHSCLSPCGDLEIYPRRIVERALEAGLDIVAVTDHNTAENAAATVRAAEGRA